MAKVSVVTDLMRVSLVHPWRHSVPLLLDDGRTYTPRCLTVVHMRSLQSLASVALT